MEEVKKIVEFNTERKISFDGQSYHSRIPTELVQILKKENVRIETVRWEGVWRDGTRVYVILNFESIENPIEEKSNLDEDYVILQ